ncbi:hypothetical protein X744_17050 [Mesorhizobium sp. LNJC372A00]|nr:hypothetical protein X745_22540 [Mesorhizobium sp. LNJC374B00]ESY58764.1 hypothetical protein X744_17050 [Mesorhizobium sp. LNJC372A00]
MRIDLELVEFVAIQIAKNFRDLGRPLVPSVCRHFGIQSVTAILAVKRAAEIRAEQAKEGR